MRIRVVARAGLAPGTVIEVSEDEAAWWVRSGHGEIAPPVVEQTTIAPPENAMRPHAKPRTKPGR